MCDYTMFSPTLECCVWYNSWAVQILYIAIFFCFDYGERRIKNLPFCGFANFSLQFYVFVAFADSWCFACAFCKLMWQAFLSFSVRILRLFKCSFQSSAWVWSPVSVYLQCKLLSPVTCWPLISIAVLALTPGISLSGFLLHWCVKLSFNVFSHI